MNNAGEMRLGEVSIEIDRGGKLVALFPPTTAAAQSPSPGRFWQSKAGDGKPT